ncbi:glucosyltransferase domain-containing protein [Hafnia alvei]|uniref:glucosyltransferase domain-containing protein n=1 Tax=Hafnia alvei TaxID=569 RepID=UPI00396C9D1A
MNLGNIDNNKLFIYFISALLCCLVVYGFELTHFTLSIDEEFSNNFRQTIGLGRWGHALIREFILPEPYAPFFTTLLSIIIISFSSAIFSYTLDVSKLNGILISALYISIPQFAYQIDFANQSDTVAISFLCSSIATLILKHSKYRFLSIESVLVVILCVTSISIYQSISTLMPTMALISITYDIIQSRLQSKKAISSMVVCLVLCIISIVIYQLISSYIQHYTGNLSGSYLSNNIRWMKEPIVTTVINSALSVSSYFTGSGFYGLNIYAITLISSIISIFIFIRDKKNPLLLILLPVIVISPFIMNLAFGSNMPPRTLTSMSAAFAGVIGLLFLSIRWNSIKIAITVIILLCGSATSSQLFYSDYISYNSDKMLANRILTAITSTIPDFNESTDKVYFYGGYRVQNNWKKNADVFGQSFFSWDRGNNMRIRAFFSTNSIAHFNGVSATAVNELRKEASKMPAWPSSGSIRKVDGVVLVKLGENPGRD